MSVEPTGQLLTEYDKLHEEYLRLGGTAFDQADEENTAINYSYHSNAIEGNTFTYEQTYDFLKTGQVIPGKSYKER